MALNYSVRYTGQVATGDSNFPYGKARNIVVEGDGTGTPWEEDLVNDVWGFLQALLVAASIAPSGSVDNATASQYLDALQVITGNNNAKRRGAKGDGTTNDAPALNAALVALAALGGTELFLPAGTYKTTSALALPENMSLRGVPGLTKILLDHPTASLIVAAGGIDETKTNVITGITFEAAQANTGKVIDATTTATRIQLINCASNQSAQLLQGPQVSAAGSVDLLGCNLISGKTDAGEAIVVSGQLTVRDGELTMAPAASDDLISAFSALLVGVKLTHISTVGDVAFVFSQVNHVTRILGCRGNVNESGAGGNKTYLLDLVAGSRVDMDDANDLASFSKPYKYTSGPLSSPSRLQQKSISDSVPAATTYEISDDTKALFLDIGPAAAPSITFPRILFQGQTLDLVIHNVHAGTWSGAPPLLAQGADDTFFQSTGLATVLTGEALTLRFVALFNYTTSKQTWTQVGAAGRLS